MTFAFVEQKEPDLDRVAELLQLSSAVNRWSNFGPVWARLAALIEDRLNLAPDRCAIPCSSGTSALFAAAALAHQHIDKSRQPFVVSAFGFRSTVIGPYNRALVLDCDETGLLDTSSLDKIEADSYGAICVTNPFGLFKDFSNFIAYSRARGYPLIIDNAAGFDALDRHDQAGVIECISLHHTKPYGVGEGGCLIVDTGRRDEALAALNLGYAAPLSQSTAAQSNGKLSDVAAAFIVDRIERESHWASSYAEQYERVEEIASSLSYKTLAPQNIVTSGIKGTIALIAPKEVSNNCLKNGEVVIHKRYSPLCEQANVARRIFKRILNFPTHAGIRGMTDRQIKRVLEHVLDQ